MFTIAANWVRTLTHILFLQSELSMLAVRVYRLLTLHQQLNICWNCRSYLAVKTLHSVKRSEFHNTIAIFMLRVGAWVPHKATNKWVKSRKKSYLCSLLKLTSKTVVMVSPGCSFLCLSHTLYFSPSPTQTLPCTNSAVRRHRFACIHTNLCWRGL